MDHPDGADDPAGGVADVLTTFVDHAHFACVLPRHPVLDLVGISTLSQ
jgi:hypothetical protein